MELLFGNKQYRDFENKIEPEISIKFWDSRVLFVSMDIDSHCPTDRTVRQIRISVGAKASIFNLGEERFDPHRLAYNFVVDSVQKVAKVR